MLISPWFDIEVTPTATRKSCVIQEPEIERPAPEGAPTLNTFALWFTSARSRDYGYGNTCG